MHKMTSLSGGVLSMALQLQGIQPFRKIFLSTILFILQCIDDYNTDAFSCKSDAFVQSEEQVHGMYCLTGTSFYVVVNHRS